MEKQWEKELFYGDSIVPVKFKRSNELQPLSILVVSDEKKQRPVIVSVGSILDEGLRQPSSERRLEKQWKTVAKKLQEELAQTRSETSSTLRNGTHVEAKSKNSIAGNYNSSTGIMASLAKVLTFGSSSTHSLYSSLLNNQSVGVTTDTRNRLFDKKRPLWKPAMENFTGFPHILEENGNYTMWVVTEIFTASELIIAKTKDAALQAGLDPSLALGDAAPGCLGKALLTCYRKKNEFLKIETPEGEPYFTYGFRALRLQYDEHGVLKLNDANMGDSQPVVRDRSSAPEEDPFFNMGDFFAQAPLADDAESADDVKCLEWDDDDDDEEPDLEFSESA